uniref:Uncharacterized protein n=1 Tax=Parascaris equorum TaxID=6256 RepID=A0A914REY2_PAREQ
MRNSELYMHSWQEASNFAVYAGYAVYGIMDEHRILRQLDVIVAMLQIHVAKVCVSTYADPLVSFICGINEIGAEKFDGCNNVCSG